MRRLLVATALLAGCVGPEEKHAVCITLEAADYAEAKRGIDWWHTPVDYRCDAPDYMVTAGKAPEDAPNACGWYDGYLIVWVCGPVFDVVRHEYGHVLGYQDTADGVMASGDWEE